MAKEHGTSGRLRSIRFRAGNMTQLLGVLTDQGSDTVLVFEVDRSEVSDDLVLASDDPARAADRAWVTLEEALAKLRPSLHKVLALLKEMSPDEAEVQFGLKIGGETGIIIAKGTVEANFTVRMSWKAGQPDAAK
jgi:hypothetical protein